MARAKNAAQPLPASHTPVPRLAQGLLPATVMQSLMPAVTLCQHRLEITSGYSPLNSCQASISAHLTIPSPCVITVAVARAESRTVSAARHTFTHQDTRCEVWDCMSIPS